MTAAEGVWHTDFDQVPPTGEDGPHVSLAWADGSIAHGCYFSTRGHKGWTRVHGYPAKWQVFLKPPHAWMLLPAPPRPTSA